MDSILQTTLMVTHAAAPGTGKTSNLLVRSVEDGVERFFVENFDLSKYSYSTVRSYAVTQMKAWRTGVSTAPSFVEHASNSSHWRECTTAFRYASPYSDDLVVDSSHGASLWEVATRGGRDLLTI